MTRSSTCSRWSLGTTDPIWRWSSPLSSSMSSAGARVGGFAESGGFCRPLGVGFFDTCSLSLFLQPALKVAADLVPRIADRDSVHFGQHISLPGMHHPRAREAR